MRPFWLRPRWIVGHVLVVALVVTFVLLGLWQLRRLDERRAENSLLESRSAAPVAPLQDLVRPDGGADDVDGVTYRRVRVTGTYDPGGEVLVRSRSLGGQPGFHVLTPLVTEGGAIVVNRGFLPRLTDDPAAVRTTAAAPPVGEVEVVGTVLPTEERGAIGPTDPGSGRLRELARVDLARIQQQYDLDLYPVHLRLVEQSPAQPDGLPVTLPEGDRGDGPHLPYAVQWFLFATVGAVGWPLLLRHTARDGAGPEEDSAAL